MSAVAGSTGELNTEVVAPTIQGRSPRQLFWMRFRQDKAAMFGACVIIILVLMAIFAGVISNLIGHGPNDVYQAEMTDDFGIPKGPNSSFWFGADFAARDLFVRVVYGARTSLLVALFATSVAMTIGVTVGVIAGYYRGFADALLSRISDIVLAMPIFLIAIGIAAACGAKEGCLAGHVEPGLSLVVFVISIFTWPYVARIIRSTTLSLREKEFVEAARSLGASDRRIIVREILPNLVAPITVYATLLIPSNILFEAALSYLGLGLPPDTPSWGQSIASAASGGLYRVTPWLMIFPGIFLVLTTLSFNLLGDGLRDAIDPRSDR